MTMEVENVYNSESAKTSSSASEESSSAGGAVAASNDDAELFSPQLLQMYYSRLFPFSMVHSWLSYGSPKTFSHREFSFTIRSPDDEEIYIRYQSFSDQNQLEQAICKRRPDKIDIGAVFSHPPKDLKTIAKKPQPVSRELVFDIDLTDYDEIRKCGCTGAKICNICWGYMKMAVKVMDQGLKQDFGFQNVAWIYSGRRGIHAWVCDPIARDLTDQGRSAVAKYFEVQLGSEKNKQMDLPTPLHPMLARSYAVLEPMFVEQILPASGHGLLASKEQQDELLDTLPEQAHSIKENLQKSWIKSNSTPAQKWDELKQHIKAYVKATSKAGSSKAATKMAPKEMDRIENWPVETVFRHSYPRLDINVSTHRNHLLKSPFCVHPKTGRVCVPIDAKHIDDFDPFDVPTLPRLMRELDAFDSNTKVAHNWQKTSLKKYFEPFQQQFLDPMLKEIKRQQRDEMEEQSAVVGDF